MMTTVIVDDDYYQRVQLRSVIEKSCADLLEVLGEAYSLKSAVRQIEALQPELVLMDIELSGHDTGFDILEAFENPSFGVIFVTAHADFAAKAYNYDPVSFLTKPVEGERLRKVVERAWRILRNDSLPEEIIFPISSETQQANVDSHITLKDGRETLVLNTEEIIFCASKGNYTDIILPDRAHTLRTPLGQIEEDFFKQGFLRIHRSTIVNPIHIHKVNNSGKTPSLLLNNGAELPISPSYKLLIAEQLGLKNQTKK